MEKKIFNKITKEVFLEYGFKEEDNKFFLLLPDVSIMVRFSSWRGVKYFNYNFGINDLYDTSFPLDKRFDSIIAIKMEHSPSLRGFHQHEILYEDYDEAEYRDLLSKMLHRYFDPYKEDAFKFLKDNDCRMCLSKKAREFLKLI